MSQAEQLPIWLNGYELVAWVRYRDPAIVRQAGDHSGLAGQNIYGLHPKVGDVVDAISALQSGTLVAFGAKGGGDFALIPAVEWTRMDIAPLDLRRHHPYVTIRYSRSDVIRIFPQPSARNSLPRLADKMLFDWWAGLDAETQGLPQSKLLELCQDAHPNHSISRQRIRALTPYRKRGPKPLGRKVTAQSPLK